MDSKPAYLSKTLWINAIVAVTAIVIPSVSQYISGHPSEVAFGVSALNIVLRLISSGKIEIW